MELDEHGEIPDYTPEEIKKWQEWSDKFQEDKNTAKRCLNYKGCECDNKDCLNENCPLQEKK